MPKIVALVEPFNRNEIPYTPQIVDTEAAFVDSGTPGNKISELNVEKLITGTIKSKRITLEVIDGNGDVWIGAGKVDFTNTDAGFIIGIDDSDGNKAKVYLGDSTNYLNWDGSTLTISGSIVVGPGTSPGIQSWQYDGAFTASDSDTVAWATGTLTLASGTTYSITGANTGNMSAKTYIYLDTAVSTTALQTSTTAGDAVGANKILIATAQNSSGGKDAIFQMLGGRGDQSVLVANGNIQANSVDTDELVASSVIVGDGDKTTFADGYDPSKNLSLDLDFMYNHNTKRIATFDSDVDSNITFTSNAEDDTTNTIAWNKATKIAGSGTRQLRATWSSDLDLEKFQDGSASSTSDYIQISVFLGGTKPSGSIVMELMEDSGDLDTNEFQKVITADVSSGWNTISIAKSEFSTAGTADWGVIGYMRIFYTGGSSDSVLAFQNLQLVRKDPSDSEPNPFQDLAGNEILDAASGDSMDLTIISEFNRLSILALGATTTARAALTTNSYQNFTAETKFRITGSGTRRIGIALAGTDSANFYTVRANTSSAVFVIDQYSPGNSTKATASYSFDDDAEYSIKVTVQDGIIYGTLFKDGEQVASIQYDTGDSALSGYVGLHEYDMVGRWYNFSVHPTGQIPNSAQSGTTIIDGGSIYAGSTITAGTGSNVAGLTGQNAAGTGPGSTDSDIRLWIGDTFANRATAPARIQQDGNAFLTGFATNTFQGLTDAGIQGTGVDGALTLTSGTTTSHNLNQVYNYSSISITGSAQITPADTDGVLIWKCTGNVTLTSSGSIDLSGKGGAGGEGGSGDGANGTDSFLAETENANFYGAAGTGNKGGGGGSSQANGGGTGSGGGAGGAAPANIPDIAVYPGAGGGGGAEDGVGSSAGDGGNGGGGFFLGFAGSLNFTMTVDCSGEDGDNGSSASAGGGGGGGGGSALFRAAPTSTGNVFTGTVTVAGGALGSGNAGGGDGGAGGDGQFKFIRST